MWDLESCSGQCCMQEIMDVSHACMLSWMILMAATHTLMHCPCMHAPCLNLFSSQLMHAKSPDITPMRLCA